MRALLDRPGGTDPEVLAVAQALVAGGAEVVEIGAARSGATARLASLVGPGGSVVAFEPDAAAAAALADDAVALGPQVAVVAGSLSAGPPVDDRPAAVQAAIDALVAGPRPVALVRTACAGADHLAVGALVEVLERWRPVLLVDFWPDAIDVVGDDPEAVVDWYRALGYAVDVVGTAAVGSTSTAAAIVHVAIHHEEAACTLLLRPVGPVPSSRPALARPIDTEEGRARLEAVAGVPHWFHAVDLGHGVRAPGHKRRSILTREWDALDLGDLTGRSVLDIGAWDGAFSFAAEAAGAARVVALDDFVWRIDRTSGGRGPEGLPGKEGFDLAHRSRGSRVESVVADIATVDTDALGTFDVVLFLGVLYHLQDPLGVLRRVRALTGGCCLIETQAIVAPGAADQRLWEFHPGAELNGDETNWFVPNLAALQAVCHAVGFDRVEVLRGPPVHGPHDRPIQYRAVVRAWV